MTRKSPQPACYIAAASWLISPDRQAVPGGAILVRDGIIADCGSLHELALAYQVPVLEFPGCALVPGFVNAHTHLELTHFPSWRLRTHVEYSPRRFVDWIIQLVKIKRALNRDDYENSVAEGVRICLESGTTAVGDIVTDISLAPLYRATPLCGRLYFELLGHDPVRFNNLLERVLTISRCSDQGSLLSGLSPHSVYTLGERHFPAVRDGARGDGLPLAIHLSESQSEVQFISDAAGPLAEELYPFVGWQQYLTSPRRCSSTELLDRSGLLTPATLAVHCVHLSSADARILKQRGVRVVICPRSNDLLDVGRAPVALFKKAGLPLALGTDSLASNNTLSLWDEMRFALDVFARDLTPAEVFHMVTLGGAEALGMDRLHGTLEPGKYANFQIVSCPGPASSPEDVLERVVFESSVQDVFIKGQRTVAVKTGIGDG